MRPMLAPKSGKILTSAPCWFRNPERSLHRTDLDTIALDFCPNCKKFRRIVKSLIHFDFLGDLPSRGHQSAPSDPVIRFDFEQKRRINKCRKPKRSNPWKRMAA